MYMDFKTTDEEGKEVVLTEFCVFNPHPMVSSRLTCSTVSMEQAIELNLQRTEVAEIKKMSSSLEQR